MLWSRSILARLRLVKMAASAPAPAPALAPALALFVAEKKCFKNFTSQLTGACFIQRKVRVICFALPVLYLKIQINFILDYC